MYRLENGALSRAPRKGTSRSIDESKHVDIKESEKVSIPSAPGKSHAFSLLPFQARNPVCKPKVEDPEVFHGAFGTPNAEFIVFHERLGKPAPITADPG